MNNGLFQLYGFELSGKDDFEHLAIVGIVEHSVLNARWLQPSGAFAHRDLALTLKFRFDPPLQDVDHLDIHVMEMTLRHDRRITRRDEADDVRLQQAIGGLAHAEIAVFRVAPQTIRPKVFRSEVTDIERLLRSCLRLRACSNRILARRLSRSRL